VQRAASIACVVLLASVAVLPAQSGQAPARDPRAAGEKPAATGLLAGTVVAADTGQPLPGVRVVLSGTTTPTARSVTTDGQGQFSFDALEASAYRLTASRAGYVDSVWGQKQPGSGRPGTPLQLNDGQQIKNLSLPIARGGVITGVIADEFGYPAAGTTVRVYRTVFRNGERVLQQAGTGQTDDRGVYRVYGLVPGDYVVIATPRMLTAGSAAELVRMEAEKAVMAGEQYARVIERFAAVERATALDRAMVGHSAEPSEGYAPVYYPGTTTASMAARVPLGVSEEKSGIDLRLQVVPLSRISGVVSGMSPQPATLTVYLTEQGPLTGLGTKTTRVGPDGRFTIAAVPPGQYTLTVRAALRPAVASVPAGAATAMRVEAQPSQWMWAQTELTVSGQPLDNVGLALAPGMSVSGTVTFRGATPPPTDLSRVRVSFLPIGQSPSAAEMELASGSARLDGQGRFTAVGMMPGRYRVTASAPGWSLSSVTAQGREALDFPIEITAGEDVTNVVATFSDRRTTLSGTLQSADGAAAPDYTVVLFAADSRFWTPFSRRIHATRPSSDGRYSFGNLPPGDYRLAAVVDPEPGQWFDPEFLRALAAASTTVTLGEGDTRTQDLRIGR
jgi:hypothetical protein